MTLLALVKAKFVVKEPKQDISVHFNPSEYSISVSHSGYTNKESAEDSHQKQPIGDKGTETLRLTLYFDTYTQYVDLTNTSTFGTTFSCEDVRIYTEKIADLVGRAGNPTPHVSFVWGSLIFTGIVSSVSQTFTMFLDDGKPVRAKLDVQMQKDDTITSESLGAGTRPALDLTSQNWKLAVAAAVVAGKLRDIL